MSNTQTALIARRDSAIAEYYALMDQFDATVESMEWGSTERRELESRVYEAQRIMGRWTNLVTNYRVEADASFAAYLSA